MILIFPSQHPRYSHVARWSEYGKRQQKFFASKKEAENWRKGKIAEFRLVDPAEEPVSAGERMAVMEAREAGVDLLAVVRAAVLAGPRSTVTLGELVRMRLEEVALARRRVRYQDSLRTFFDGVLRRIPGEMAAGAVTGADLSKIIFAGKAAGSVSRARAVLHGLFECGRRQAGLVGNPVDGIPTVSADRDGDVSILTVAEGRGLWEACRQVAPVLCPALGLAMWAGLRKAESAGLRWADVRLGTSMVFVGGHIAKTRQKRLVTIHPPLRMALEMRAGRVGKVEPPNFRRLWKAVRNAAGWQVDQGDAGKPWPRNVLRHSYVSYHLAHFQDAARTALEAGHSQTVLFRHYRDLIATGEAGRWWQIPGGI